MPIPNVPPAVSQFVDYFGEIGPRWGLPREACRVHAYLYLLASPASKEAIAKALSITVDVVADAIDFLKDYRIVTACHAAQWCTSDDPWEMLMRGLEERKQRELPQSLRTLRNCLSQARTDAAASGTTTRQIQKMLSLVEDLAAIDAGSQRISPRLIRGLIGVSGKAARFMDTAFHAKSGVRL